MSSTLRFHAEEGGLKPPVWPPTFVVPGPDSTETLSLAPDAHSSPALLAARGQPCPRAGAAPAAQLMASPRPPKAKKRLEKNQFRFEVKNRIGTRAEAKRPSVKPSETRQLVTQGCQPAAWKEQRQRTEGGHRVAGQALQPVEVTSPSASLPSRLQVPLRGQVIQGSEQPALVGGTCPCPWRGVWN